MSRVTVIYASRCGQAAAIATRIGRVATDEGHAVTVLPVDDPAVGDALGESDVVVIGAGVRYGRHGRAIERVVRQNLGLVSSRPHAFFSVSLSAARAGKGQRTAARYINAFSERTGWFPERSIAFAGALPFTRYNPFLRLLMLAISKSVGGDTDTSRDYEYTDWAQVERFARELVKESRRWAA